MCVLIKKVLFFYFSLLPCPHLLSLDNHTHSFLFYFLCQFCKINNKIHSQRNPLNVYLFYSYHFYTTDRKIFFSFNNISWKSLLISLQISQSFCIATWYSIIWIYNSLLKSIACYFRACNLFSIFCYYYFYY